jgi:hypothetical protein
MSGPNHPRGTSNSNQRGSAAQRRVRKRMLLAAYGDGELVACLRQVSPKCGYVLDFETVTVDRLGPGYLGGRYVRNNVVPACGSCNSLHGNWLRWDPDRAARSDLAVSRWLALLGLPTELQPLAPLPRVDLSCTD